MIREPIEMNPYIIIRLLLILAVAWIFTGCTNESKPKDSKLAALQAELDAAVTTFDMNCKSLELYEHLNKKVFTLEDQIKKDLDPQFLASFEKSSAFWREYRKAEADLAYDECGRGTIRTLMRNGTLIRLSRERLAYLQDSDPEGRYRENALANVEP